MLRLPQPARASVQRALSAAASAAALPRASASRPAARALHIDASSLKGRHLDSLFSLSAAELTTLLDLSAALKRALRKSTVAYAPLRGRSLAMIFQKRSTRTRVSTEAGFARLGGHPIFLGAPRRAGSPHRRSRAAEDAVRECAAAAGGGGARRRSPPCPCPLFAPPPSCAGSEDIQLGQNESLADTARVLSRFNDGILARVYAHGDIEGLCAESAVPVINALSDREHPLQGLADLLTLREHFGSLRGLTLAWVGDGNNVAHTLLSAAGPMGYHMQLAMPPGYACDAAVLARARRAAAAAGTRIEVGTDARAALAGAHVVVTDTWVSMGQEAEKAARLAAFAGFQVTERLAAEAGAHPQWRFLHCLPRKPEEVDDAVFYSPTRSLVWDEAENRMWTVMAVLLAQMDGGAVLPATA